MNSLLKELFSGQEISSYSRILFISAVNKLFLFFSYYEQNGSLDLQAHRAQPIIHGNRIFFSSERTSARDFYRVRMYTRISRPCHVDTCHEMIKSLGYLVRKRTSSSVLAKVHRVVFWPAEILEKTRRQRLL